MSMTYSAEGRSLRAAARRHWPLLAIAVANVIAAIVLFLAGMWAANTNRYDGCQYVDVGAPAFWACPAER